MLVYPLAAVNSSTLGVCASYFTYFQNHKLQIRAHAMNFALFAIDKVLVPPISSFHRDGHFSDLYWSTLYPIHHTYEMRTVLSNGMIGGCWKL